MDLILNRPHSKANELKVGTGEALALAQARQGFFFASRRGTRVELIKSTIQVRQRGRRRPGNLAPACRSGLRCV